MKKGCMIVIDGGNGAGKGTVLKTVEAYLRAIDIEPVMTREPGGTPIGEKIREVILSKDTPEMFDVTELMLFAAVRAQHVREKILPAIAAGKVVVSDRFDSSTISFQHYGRGISMDLIRQLNDIALDGFQPDITIILDLDPVVGLERVRARGDQFDRLEKEDIEFLQRAREGYLAQARENPDKFVIIDASRPLERVVADTLAAVEKRVLPVAGVVNAPARQMKVGL